MVIVAGLHAAVLAVLLGARARVESPPPVLVQVGFIEPAVPHETPPEAPPARLAPVAVQVALPVVDIPADTPAPHAITVAAAQAPAMVQTGPAASGPSGPQGEPRVLSIEEVGYLRAPAPHYPRIAKQERMQGTVLLWVLIDEQGKPREVKVQQSSGHALLDREGRDAVRRALFRPYLRQGRPQVAQVIVPVQFLLEIHAGR